MNSRLTAEDREPPAKLPFIELAEEITAPFPRTERPQPTKRASKIAGWIDINEYFRATASRIAEQFNPLECRASENAQ